MKLEKVPPVTDILLLIGILLLPFYIFPSGSIQPSHAFLITGATLFVLFGSRLFLELREVLAGFFLAFYILLVGFTWYLLIGDTAPAIGALQHAINVFISIAIVARARQFFSLYQRFVPLAFLLGLIFQVTWYVFGIGMYGGTRFLGTFNDPNQLAYWVICMAGVSLIIARPNTSVLTLIMVLATFTLILTKSRSGFIGFAPIFALFSFSIIFYVFSKSRFRGTATFLFLLVGLYIFVFAQFFGLLSFDETYTFFLNETLVFWQRLEMLDINNQLELRGYDRFRFYPDYVIFGAGQGGGFRFPLVAYPEVEIHSTIVGFLFYYGMIGFGFALFFLIIVFRNCSLFDLVVFSGPIIYGLGTYGARNTAFWLLIAFIASSRGQIVRALPTRALLAVWRAGRDATSPPTHNRQVTGSVKKY